MTRSAAEALSRVLYVNVEQLLIAGDRFEDIHSSITDHVVDYCSERLQELAWRKIWHMDQAYKRADKFDKQSSSDQNLDSYSERYLDEAVEEQAKEGDLIVTHGARLARGLMDALIEGGELFPKTKRELIVQQLYERCKRRNGDVSEGGEEDANRYSRVLRFLISGGVPTTASDILNSDEQVSQTSEKETLTRQEFDYEFPF